MSDHISVLSNQNGDLVGHMSFQGRKIICSPDMNLPSLTSEKNKTVRVDCIDCAIFPDCILITCYFPY